MPRRKHDAYMTPRYQVQCLLDHQPLGDGVRIVEPCVGDGAISRVLIEQGHQVITNDLDTLWPADYHLDAAEPDVWTYVRAYQPDWVISNTPFKTPTQQHILEHALRSARVGVALIARLSFLEPVDKWDRGKFLKAHPPQRQIVMPRHSYTNDGKSDSVTTAWMIWLVDEGWKDWAQGEPPIIIAHGADADV